MDFISTTLQGFPPIILSLFSFLFAYGFVFFFGYIAGKKGLYTILVLLVIAANLQVLKVTQYSFFNHPVALGTEIFAATYLVTDILSEVYDKKTAIGGVVLTFLAMLFWVLFTIITLGFAPITQEQVGGNMFLYSIHEHFNVIFTPAPAILLASITAFLLSQLCDIYIFSYIKKKTHGKLLWLRNNVSTILAALLDNAIFTVLAFILLSKNPLSLEVAIKSYILGTYVFRVIAALLDTPIMYLAKKCILPDKHTNHT